DHGPNGGLRTSGAPVVSQRARSGIHWDLSGTAESPRIGCHVVRDGGDARADLRGATFRCAVRHGAKDGHRAWCLRSVVHCVRSTVPAREFGGIEVSPKPITNLVYLNSARRPCVAPP